jgi:short subunit dehydrogenase-like uncharacterized protein
MSWMIYGANGYTGELIARQAVALGMAPVLAGRSAAKIQPLAQQLGLPHRVFDLSRPQAEWIEQLHGMQVVLLAAGPFSATADAMARACIQAGVHYLDITGEIDVFEHLHSLHAVAKAAGVVLCPGVGFDVIPTDCVALALKEAMPDATHLALGFETAMKLSPGTLKTSLESAPQGGRVRRDGRLMTVPLAHEVRRIDFGQGEKLAVAVPWGDVSTAFHTTGIPNVTVFIPSTRLGVWFMKLGNVFQSVLAMPWVQSGLQRLAGAWVKGPDEAARALAPSHVWGEATNAQGQRVTARVQTANGYSFTVPGALTVAKHLLTSSTPTAGFTTPARLMGSDLVTQVSPSSRVMIQAHRTTAADGV